MNYIGSKLSLLGFIDQSINEFVGEEYHENMMFCDIFAGTGVVGKYFKNLGYSIIANDIQAFSYYIIKAIIENNTPLRFERLKANGIKDPFMYLNNLKGRKGFIYKNYSFEGSKNGEFPRKYFSEANAEKIDAIRLKINYWKKKGLINEKEYYFLVASLIESSDRVANTASVYEAFLKDLKSSAIKPLVLCPIDLSVVKGNHSYFATNEDAESLIEHISGDILYLDPPYNSRKYNTNYHMLETIALYDNPKIKGKTGVRIDEEKKSKFCMRNCACEALETIIKNAKFKYIFLSYNDEGIISLSKIEEIFNKYGTYERKEISHRRFKSSDINNVDKVSTIEYLHCLRKEI